jgi:hypothetical protein
MLKLPSTSVLACCRRDCSYTQQLSADVIAVEVVQYVTVNKFVLYCLAKLCLLGKCWIKKLIDYYQCGQLLPGCATSDPWSLSSNPIIVISLWRWKTKEIVHKVCKQNFTCCNKECCIIIMKEIASKILGFSNANLQRCNSRISCIFMSQLRCKALPRFFLVWNHQCITHRLVMTPCSFCPQMTACKVSRRESMENLLLPAWFCFWLQ